MMLYMMGRNEIILAAYTTQVLRAEMTEEINKADSIQVEIRDAKKEADNDRFEYILHTDPIKENQVRIYKIKDWRVDGRRSSITGVHVAYDDLQAHGYMRDRRFAGAAIREVLTAILDGTRWEIGELQVDGTVSTNFYYISRLEALSKLIELTHAEMRPRITHSGYNVTGRYIDLVQQLGTDDGKLAVYGSNLLEVVAEDYRGDIYTALVGRGRGEEVTDESGEGTGNYARKITFADVVWSKANGDPLDKPAGQEWLEWPERTQQFGYPTGQARTGIVEFPDIEHKELLLWMTYAELQKRSRPQVTYRAQVRSFGNADLGDTFTVIRKDIDLVYKTRVFKKVTNLLKPDQAIIYLGDKIIRRNRRS